MYFQAVHKTFHNLLLILNMFEMVSWLDLSGRKKLFISASYLEKLRKNMKGKSKHV